MKKTTLALGFVMAAAAAGWVADDGLANAGARLFTAAPSLASTVKTPIVAATTAGKRVVAVGDYGIIIYSDDGKTFTQATVPTRAPLTSVTFVDAQRGWAAGHDGAILATTDGGKTWRVLREQRGTDEVLTSIWFENAEHGLVVGQFGLAMETQDGGQTWQDRVLVDGEAGEKHFQHIFAAGGGVLLVAAEDGTLLRSADSGKQWKAIKTGNPGSFWTGSALSDGTLLVAGMRGHVFRSKDRGLSWAEVPSGTQQSLTGIAQAADGVVHVVGLAGVSLISKDQGQHFEVSERQDRAAHTAIAVADGRVLRFSLSGLVTDH